MTQDIVKALNDRYGFYNRKHVKIFGKSVDTQRFYFTDKAIESHLTGKYAIGTFAGEKATRYISIDIDAGGKSAVRKIVDALVEIGIPRDHIYISLSGKKGYHVDMYFLPWLYNSKAKNLYELVIWKTELDPKKVEFRPTNTLAGKMPLGYHQETGNRCWFLDQDTLQPIESEDYILKTEFINADTILPILKKWNKKRWNELYADMVLGEERKTSGKNITFNSEYYEEKRLKEPGTRHRTMLEIAVDMRHCGANKHSIQKALTGFYYHQDQSLIGSSEKEVIADISDISEWAEESVPIWWASKTNEIKPIEITRLEAEKILSTPTPTCRMIAAMLYGYCKIFGGACISYNRIVNAIGCSQATAEKSIKYMRENGVIQVKSGGCIYRNGSLHKMSNTYYIPRHSETLYGASYFFENKLDDDNIEKFYLAVMTGLFTDQELAEKMKKPELEKCIEYRRTMNDRESQDGNGRECQGGAGVH